jgi:hypothetical protein
MGNKSTCIPSVTNAICEWIASGKSLRAYCRQDDNPSLSTVMDWLNDEANEDFRIKYARARETQAEVLADELMEIADEDKGDALKLQHDKMKIETRQWIASKLLPKKYGNRIEYEDTSKQQRKLVIVVSDKDIE